jgi:hypothetical protein
VSTRKCLSCKESVILNATGDCAISETSVPSYPIRVSDNGRHFVQSDGRPFFFHADTAWKLFWEFTRSEAEVYLDNRKQKGFTAIQVQLLPHRDYQANRYGDTPFLVRGDMTTPNPAYFAHVDWVVDKAMEKGLGLLIAPAWASSWEQDWHRHLNSDNARSYAAYLADRYKGYKNIIGWIQGGDDDALQLHDAFRICGRTMKEIAPQQLHTFHAYIKGAWKWFHNEPWYDFNMAYAYDYADMVKQLTEAYSLSPAKPGFLGETHYEYNLGITAAHIRQYAWTSVLLGTAGQTYGNKDIWIATCFWRTAMDAPGAHSMSHLRKLFERLQWQHLVPDIERALVIEGCGAEAEFTPAAYATDGSVAVIYVPTERTLEVNTRILSQSINAYWFDPTNGSIIGTDASPCRETCRVKTPGTNSHGDEDWVLLLGEGLSLQ